MSEQVEVKVEKGRHWTRVYTEVEGADVSHLGYSSQPVRVGPAATLSMAGIGGVGTEPAYRRLGLARQVYARAMEEIRKDGFGSVGLYTGTENVAHRLYRRFGFVDTLIPRMGAKLIAPEQALVKLLSALLQGEELDPELEAWRCTLQVRVRPHEPVSVRIEQTAVRLLPSPPAEIGLSLAMSSATFLQLGANMGRFNLDFAETARQVQWQGDPEHWHLLRRAIGAQYRVIRQGG